LKIRVPRAYYNKKGEAIKAIKEALIKNGLSPEDIKGIINQL